VLPLLAAKCGGCHGPKFAPAGLDLHEISLVAAWQPEWSVIVKGLREGEPALDSRAGWRNASGQDKLAAGEIELLRRWIDGRALGGQSRAARYRNTNPRSARRTASSGRSAPSLRWPSRKFGGATSSESRRLIPAVEARSERLTTPSPASKTVLIRRAYLDLRNSARSRSVDALPG
jgi:hypothetical protein